MSRQCWLCLNSKHAEAQKMHTFMLQNISTIGAEAMADMISKHLEGVDPAGEGGAHTEPIPSDSPHSQEFART